MAPPTNFDILLVQLQYPGMPRLESSITRAWIKAHGLEYDWIDFNVRVGKGTTLGPEFPEFTREQALKGTQKRVDIVAAIYGSVDLIEVKERANASALGQLMMYRTLWRADHPEYTVRNLKVIAHDIDFDMSEAYRASNVDVELFPRETA
jgi:hypothetical protein